MRAGAVIAASTATLVANSLPALTGALGRYLSMAPNSLGAFATADVVGLTVGGLIAIPLMHGSSPRVAAIVGLIALAIANVASAGCAVAAGLVLLRLAGGLGSGIVLGASYYVFGLSDRERNFAAYSVGMTALGFCAMTVIPWLTHGFGWQAAFLFLSAAAALALIFARHYPAERLVRTTSIRPLGADPRSAIPLALGIASMTAFFLGQGGLWTYLERIGSTSGLSEEQLATSLSVCGAFGLISSVVVLAVGEHVTRPRVLIGAVAANVFAALAVNSTVPWIYASAISVFYASLPVIATIQFAAVTRLPNTSRAAVLSSVAQMSGLALGPLAGAQIVEHYGYGAVPWLDVTFVCLAGLLVAPLMRRPRVPANRC